VLKYERTIAQVSGHSLTLDNPIVMALDPKYDKSYINLFEYSGRVSDVGVENLACESEFASEEDEKHATEAVKFDHVENAWARNVTAKYFVQGCVLVDGGAKNVSVLDCASAEPKSVITGARRYSFNLNGQQSLVMNCAASEGRHDFVSGTTAKGPNVFSHCTASRAINECGPHMRWSSGVLYDNITTDGGIFIQARYSYRVDIHRQSFFYLDQ
jgi:hypothetical protein